jgi:hypothetical protein
MRVRLKCAIVLVDSLLTHDRCAFYAWELYVTFYEKRDHLGKIVVVMILFTTISNLLSMDVAVTLLVLRIEWITCFSSLLHTYNKLQN